MEVEERAPTFSVVAVIKNVGSREAMFRRSVESVLGQTCGDLELVIQDGGSTDATARIVAEFADPRIRFVSTPDSSAEEGLFRALKRCRGRYIGTCLSDEELAPDALENALRAFEENPRAAGIYGDYWTVDENGNKQGPFFARHPFSIEAYVCQTIVPPFCSSFFSREHLERAGIHDHPWRHRVGEFEFWIRLANAGPIVYVPIGFSYFGRHSQSNTCNAALYDRLTSERAAVMADLFQENKILQDSGVAVNQAIAGNYAWAANSVFGIEGASDRYRRFVKTASACDPHSPFLPHLMQRLTDGRSPGAPVQTGEEGCETAAGGDAERTPEPPHLDSAAGPDDLPGTPYLSVVVATRNDDHGGNLKLRMQLFINCLAAQARKHRLPTELVLVEWNPPADRPRLAEVLSLPSRHPFCSMRIIEVPAAVHARYRHADALPVYQMIAKNVGLRRARGRFVLATNVDILFSDSLFARLARRDLEPGRFYRSVRRDVDNRLTAETPLDAVLEHCRSNVVRTNLRDYSLDARDGSRHIVYPPGATEAQLGHPMLFTNACGDFTLLARQDWTRLRGYAELDMYSFHLDSLFLFAAHHAGLEEVVFPDDMTHYHIEHGGGWTPEVHRDRSLDKRIDGLGIPRLSTEAFSEVLRRMGSGKIPPVCNRPQWGLADVPLSEAKVTLADWESPQGSPGDAPYLSLVVTTRNDDHGGNMLQRFQSFLDHLGQMCARHRLAAELIVVEWNPAPDRPRLLEAVRWPDSATLDVRIITVPPHIHAGHKNADKFPLFQMIAKNVGMRRARGEFILATNVDLLFSEELFEFLARRELDAECLYRIDRHDIGVTNIPEGLDWEQRLRFCERNIIRVHAQHGTYLRGQPAPAGNPEKLHTNACGDFTLMSRRKWLEVCGYPEFHLWSIFLDGLLVHAAAAAGLKQIILRDPCRVYHIEHDLGWARTTEPVKARPSLGYSRHYLPLCKGIMEKKPLKINKAAWGLADVELEETRPKTGASSDRAPAVDPGAGSESLFARWIDVVGGTDNRLYYRDQSAQSLAGLAETARRLDPTVIVELGTLAGLSLRTWLAASQRARIVAIDLSFATLTETCRVLPADLSRVTLLERDILRTDFPSLWTAQDRVLLFVDAHDLPGVPIMEHVLTTALPALPDGSLVVVDDLWHSGERLTRETARRFLDDYVCHEIDELQCFDGHFAPYHGGGSFMGFAEVIPLLSFINRHGIALSHDPGGKHVSFVWKTEYLSRGGKSTAEDLLESQELCGSVPYNPLESVPAAPPLADRMRRIAHVYRQRGAREAAESLFQALTQHPRDEGLSYGLAVCLARGGMLSQARDVLARNLSDSSCPRYRRLHDDLARHVSPAETRRPEEPKAAPDAPTAEEVVYALSLTPEQRTCKRLPRMVDASHLALFSQSKTGVPGYLSKPIVSEVEGIEIIRHRDCVLQIKDASRTDRDRSLIPSDYWEVLPDGPGDIECTQPVLPWIYAWSHYWQHSVQDTFPVIVACRDYLRAHPEVAILVSEPTHDCLPVLLREAGITNRVWTAPPWTALRVRCRELLAPRVLPRSTMWSWPPELYRRMAGQAEENPPQDLLIYTSRRGCSSRRVKNETEVVEFLEATARKWGLELLVFDASRMSPPERVAAFRRARVVVGPHGGANYHVLFCRPGTSFIEWCFYRDMHTLYNIASGANLDYWMLPVDGGQHTPETEVDIELLDRALRSIFGNDEQSVKEEKMSGSTDYTELSTVLDSFSSFSVIERLRASHENYNVYTAGAAYQKERIASVAACCVRDHPGDLIEIGCYVGGTTRHLCQVARRYGRRVIAVDPWEIGTQNCTGGEYAAFLKNIDEFRDIVDIIRSSSLAPDAIRQIQSRELAFAFVDGLHNYEACRSDIRAVSHCHGVIAVDDTSWCPGARQAFLEAGKELNRSLVSVPVLREGYLLACSTRTSGSEADKRTISGAGAGCAGRSDAQPGLTLFAMPKPFTGHNALIQKNAIRSWAKLNPAPEIILFGDEPGIREMAAEVGARHAPEVARNEFGTPLVDRLFRTAESLASHDVLAYVNADMILMQDFAAGVQKVQAGLPNFLLIGQRWDLSVLAEIDFDDPQWRRSLQRQMQEHAMLHAECGLDYFVFRRGLWPQIPAFAIGRTAWDNWLVMDPRKRGVPVVDGTAFITAVHQDHDYGHMAGGRREAWNGREAERNRELAGPADHFGLTTGASWLLREDGALIPSEPRRPQYITAAYRDQRSAWLLRQAGELIAAGARELAACKCEEALTCLDGWGELRRLGCIPAEPAKDVDIGGRYIAGYTLLARCHMQSGCYEQVVATYNRLLENPGISIPATRRQRIVQVRDRLARLMEGGKQGVNPPAGQGRSDAGSEMGRPSDSESFAACLPASANGNDAAAGSRPKVTAIPACRNGERRLPDHAAPA